MASFGEYMTRTMQAAANLTTYQYRIMRRSGVGLCNVASGAASTTLVLGGIGILMNAPDSGQAATIAYMGEVKVKAGTAVTENVFITWDSSGMATAAVSGDIAIGRALEAAGNAGEIIRCTVFPAQPLLRT